MQRIIMHVDMDYFFAAVEERLHPECRGKPVVVGADPKEGKGRGVVSTCNYEARKFGIRSGMPISKAWQLCRDAVYIPVNMQAYSETSSRIMGILRRFAEKFESWGIDEAFLDVTGKVGSFEEAVQLALEIKREIYEKEQITCSIGIAPNRLVAKIACGFKKPDGLMVVRPEEVEQFLRPLPARELIGVGRKSELLLSELGIKTIGELADCGVNKLVEIFGAAAGHSLHRTARGIDESEVKEREETKSIGRRLTFEEDTSDKELIFSTLAELAQEVHREVKELSLQFRTVTAEVRYEDFETHTKSRTLRRATSSGDELAGTAKELLEPFLNRGRMLRLVGVRVAKLSPAVRQKSLLEYAQ